MADRFLPPTASIQPFYGDNTVAPALPATANYSQMVNRAQGVAERAGGQNYSGEFSSTFSTIAKIMKGIGGGANISAMLGSAINTDKFTRSQKSAYKKYNESAQKLGEKTKEMSGLRDQMATLQGKIDALQQAGCEFTKALEQAENQMEDLKNQVDDLKDDLKIADDKYKRAEQDFKNAMNETGITPQSRRQKLTDANNRMRDSSTEKNQIMDKIDAKAGEYSNVANGYNSTLDQSNGNLEQIQGGLEQMTEYQKAGGLTESQRQEALQGMGSANQDMRAGASDYINGVKNWGMVSAGGQQMSGWADSVEQFGNGEFYKASASSINQTINTIRQFGESGGAVGNMITPFLEQAITQAGNVMQAGGTSGDYGNMFMQATFGYNDWRQGVEHIENASSYMDAGDNFMAGVEINNSVSPFFSGIGKAYQTGSVFSGTGNPLSGMAIDFVGTVIADVGGEIISDFEIAKAGGDTFGSMISGITSPLNAIAKGVGNLMDKFTSGLGDMKTNWSSEISRIRGEWKSELSNLNLTQVNPNIYVPDVAFNPNTYVPTFDPDCPNVTDRLKDPTGSSSRGGKKGCPVKKPDPSTAIVTE